MAKTLVKRIGLDLNQCIFTVWNVFLVEYRRRRYFIACYPL